MRLTLMSASPKNPVITVLFSHVTLLSAQMRTACDALEVRISMRSGCRTLTLIS